MTFRETSSRRMNPAQCRPYTFAAQDPGVCKLRLAMRNESFITSYPRGEWYLLERCWVANTAKWILKSNSNKCLPGEGRGPI